MFVCFLGSVSAQTMKFYSIGENYIPTDSIEQFSQKEGTLGGVAGEIRATLAPSGKCYSLAFTSEKISILDAERFKVAVEKNYDIEFSPGVFSLEGVEIDVFEKEKERKNYFLSILDDPEQGIVVFFTITDLELLEECLVEEQENANEDF